MDWTVCAGDPIATPAPADPGEPALTIRDIASFRPTPPAFAMEPDGWAVVGLPTNFTTEAGQEVRTGTLLGRGVEVRFTPIGYRWQFSDGITLSSANRGATWAELGAREFTETDTTRRFDTPGHVNATLIVTYTAEYRFTGSIWRTIDGTLDATGQPRDILIGEFDTVLTDGDCTTNPTGPGC